MGKIRNFRILEFPVDIEILINSIDLMCVFVGIAIVFTCTKSKREPNFNEEHAKESLSAGNFFANVQ